MRRFAVAVLLLLASCRTATEPVQLGKTCGSSAECAAPQRCYLTSGNALGTAICEAPGRACTATGPKCPGGQECAVSIEFKGGQAPLFSCQPIGVPGANDSPFG